MKKLEAWDANEALQRLSPSALEEIRIAALKAESEVTVSRSASLPSVDLGSSVSQAVTHRPVFASQPESWSVGISASVPIFSRFENQSRHESAILLLSSARLKLLDKEQGLRQETGRLAALIQDRINANRQRKTFLERARTHLTKARERFLAGRISSNDLSVDESRVSQMEQALIGNDAALQQDVLQLCALLTIPLPDCLSKLSP